MERRGPVKSAFVGLLLLAACTAVAPKLDPATLGTVAPEEKFVVTAGAQSVTVDHLRIGTDSIWGRRAPASAGDAPTDLAFARETVTDLRRSSTGGPDVQLLVLPVALMVVALVILKAGLGGGY